MNRYFVCIVASSRNSKLYIGVTNDLKRRVYEYKNDLIKGFTSKYSIHRLVYFEETSNIDTAITREKQLKNWQRAWKIELIEKSNSTWKNLDEEIV